MVGPLLVFFGVFAALALYMTVGWALALYATRRDHRAYLECCEKRKIEGRSDRIHTCPGTSPAHDHHPNNRPDYNTLVLTWLPVWLMEYGSDLIAKIKPTNVGTSMEEQRLDLERKKALTVLIEAPLDQKSAQDTSPKQITNGRHTFFWNTDVLPVGNQRGDICVLTVDGSHSYHEWDGSSWTLLMQAYKTDSPQSQKSAKEEAAREESERLLDTWT